MAIIAQDRPHGPTTSLAAIRCLVSWGAADSAGELDRKRGCYRWIGQPDAQNSYSMLCYALRHGSKSRVSAAYCGLTKVVRFTQCYVANTHASSADSTWNIQNCAIGCQCQESRLQHLEAICRVSRWCRTGTRTQTMCQCHPGMSRGVRLESDLSIAILAGKRVGFQLWRRLQCDF
ncbi:hypothetical protein BV25DRAFT_436294 [Artomyces pyxidatus]|uniref:Uncharacterized protein n=1 Tax=Artomyces pyxidatus TaxID=48021 RepID=A0ACB8T2I7_9AGAM|nr:hypothetical protein BV25DRAFT_436294 [Artomyces pyxidatus]